VESLRLIGWSAKVDLAEGLSRTIDWYRLHDGRTDGAS
jgi:nucleoside-diphosphate-sugar epimerase